jgi:hypothetical protein
MAWRRLLRDTMRLRAPPSDAAALAKELSAARTMLGSGADGPQLAATASDTGCSSVRLHGSISDLLTFGSVELRLFDVR